MHTVLCEIVSLCFICCVVSTGVQVLLTQCDLCCPILSRWLSMASMHQMERHVPEVTSTSTLVRAVSMPVRAMIMCVCNYTTGVYW